MAPIPDFSSLNRALVIKPSSLGDIVHALPAVHALKRTFPQLKIGWLANPEWMPLLEGNQDIDELIPFPRSEFRGLAGLIRFRKWARSFAQRPAPDVALDFQGLLRSGYVAKRSRAKCAIGLGDSREGARFFHHVRVPVGPAQHSVDRCLSLAKACGAGVAGIEFPLPAGAEPKGEIPPKFVVLHPCSRGKGKSLSHSHITAFCESMAPVPIVIVGRTDEAASPKLPANGVSLLNQTSLLELIWIMRRANFIVSVDSGPMHIAAALTPRLLGIHTWSDPRLVGPYRKDAWVWKGGQIVRCGEVDATLASARESFADPHISKLAQFVQSQWDNSLSSKP